MTTYEQKSKSSNPRVRKQCILQSQAWINNQLLESAYNDNRFLLYHLLRFPAVKPSQVVINEAFVRSVRNSHLQIAQLLACNDSGVCSIDEHGFEEACISAIEDQNIYSLQWLLNGRLGFPPPQRIVDEAFIELYLKGHPPSQPILSLCSLYATHTAKKHAEETAASRRAAIERHRRREAVFANRNERRLDIHAYNNTMVLSSSSSAPDPQELTGSAGEEHMDLHTTIRSDRSQRLRLNDAILLHMRQRVGEVTMSTASIQVEILDIISARLPEAAQDSALRIVGDVLNEQSNAIFAVTLTFIRNFYPQKADVWIHGFISESILVNSCNPGALERVVTGLRGLDDPGLDAIFAQAEAPQLAAMFLIGKFNIFSAESAAMNAKELAKELVVRGATGETTAGDAAKLLRDYAVAAVEAFGVDPNSFVARIDAIIEMLEDCYDSNLKPFVDAEIHCPEGGGLEVSSSAENGAMEFEDRVG